VTSDLLRLPQAYPRAIRDGIHPALTRRCCVGVGSPHPSREVRFALHYMIHRAEPPAPAAADAGVRLLKAPDVSLRWAMLMRNTNQGALDRTRSVLQDNPVNAAVVEELISYMREVKELLVRIDARTDRQIKEYYTVEEVGELTGRAPFTVRRWIKEGRIEATRVEGTGPKGRLLIHRSQLGKLILSGRGSEVPASLETNEETG
jgi:excisionase family DNA binding protein